MLKWSAVPLVKQSTCSTSMMADNLAFSSAPEKYHETSLHDRDTVKIDRRESEPQNGNTKSPMDLEEDSENPITNFFTRKIKEVNKSTKNFMQENKRTLRFLMAAILNIAFLVYFFIALHYWNTNEKRSWELCDGFGMLLILYCIVYFYVIYFLIVKKFFGKKIHRAVLAPIYRVYCESWKRWFIRWILYIVLLVALIVFLVVDTEGSRERLTSVLGLVVILMLGFIFSRSPSKIRWRPVVWGLILQFILGLITIRWEVGRSIFQCIGDKVSAFLSFTDAGSSFVFGDYLVNELGVLCFKALPVIFFMSLMIEVLFYWGAMQWVCLKLGWCLQISLGTTVCESVICSANTFLGMTESPLLIRPYILDMTNSEMFALMTGGFATVSGTVLAAYISFGVQPAHLITASVMSAPASLCFAKLMYPETEDTKTSINNIQTFTSENSSVLDAAGKGASNAIPLILGIVANLVAFVALIAFLNSIIGWLGMLVGLDFLSFEWIFGKIFIPLSWIMGVPWEECELVGNLIGLKTVVNEFVAYQRLGEYKDKHLLSSRAEAIATYALCGFTNPGSVGILVGALGALCPSRRSDVANLAIRSLAAGCGVCFMTACIAGILLTPGAFGTINSNSTNVII